MLVAAGLRCHASFETTARFVFGVAFGAMSCTTTGCATSDGTPMLGTRPLIYKQGPGDEAARRQAANERPNAAPPASTPNATTTSPPPAAPAAVPSPATTAAPPAAPAPVAPATPAPVAPAAAPVGAQGAAAHGLPPGLARYTQATRYGDLLFLSGQIGVDPRTGDFAAEAPAEQQTRQAMENIRTVLEAHGLTMANIVSVTVYVSNIATLGAVDAAYAPFFKSALPARSVVEVQRLPRSALVEITVVAGR